MPLGASAPSARLPCVDGRDREANYLSQPRPWKDRFGPLCAGPCFDKMPRPRPINPNASCREPPGLAARDAVLVATLILIGLAFDQALEFWGQTLTNVAIWAAFLYLLRRAGPGDQLALVLCVFYATLGEIFLSLVWGLYEYRLANVPLFVPPGHALLFMLGRVLAERARDWIVWCVPLASAPLVLIFAWTGLGTLDALLFAIFLLCLLSRRAGKLYATMFVLSLAMEIYGTWLGNWTWIEVVPRWGLTTVNPPLAAGAFYCMLDMLIVGTIARLRRPSAPHVLAASR